MENENPYDSNGRLTHLEEIASRCSLAARDAGQRCGNLRSELQRLARRRDEIDDGPGFVRSISEAELKRLNEQIEAIDTDLVDMESRYKRLGQEHQQVRKTYQRAKARAKDLGLPIPIDSSGDPYASEPTRFAPETKTTNEGTEE